MVELAVGAVLPGLWLAYLVAGAPPLRRRLLGAVVGGVTFVAVAGAWILAVQLTPLSSRPWVGGSSDGTAWDLVVGYNGFGRITGSGGPFDDLPDNPPGPGSGTSGTGDMGGMDGTGGFMTGPDGVDEFGGELGIGRLFNMGMGESTPVRCVGLWCPGRVGGRAPSGGRSSRPRQRRRSQRGCL